MFYIIQHGQTELTANNIDEQIGVPEEFEVRLEMVEIFNKAAKARRKVNMGG